MPTYDFTSPEGKSYTIEGPEGSTREQAAQMLPQKYPELAQQFQGQTGQAPKPTEPTEKPQEAPQEKSSALKNIGISTGIGAAFGAATPELVSGLGMAAMAFPLTAPAAPVLFATGRAMRAGRVAEALAGAGAGLLGGTAEEGVKAAGGSNTAQTVAGVAGGMLSPGASTIAHFVPSGIRTAWKALQKFTEGAEVSAEAAAKATRAKLQGVHNTNQPLLDTYMVLQKGAEADVAAAKTAAVELESKAHAKAADLLRTNPEAAQRLIADARVEGKKLQEAATARMTTLEKASQGKAKLAERVLKQSEPELAKVGGYREISDIGKDLRGKVTTEQQGAIAKRLAEDKQLRGVRDAAVQARETSGQFVDAQPGMQALKAELGRKLLLTKKGQEAAGGMAEVTESGVAGAYQKVYDAVSNRRVQTGVNAEGNPTFTTFKTSFEALDHVRRKLGDAAFGGEKEGYGALGQNIAKDLYEKISKIQKDYAGEAQTALQAHYHEATTAMGKFGTASGKKLTAVDRIDPEVFAKDPAAIPAAYFKTQQGVKDLLELTGDASLVKRAAEDYTTRQLAGKSASQVSAWVKAPAQTDWMREVPGLQASVQRYGEKLGKIESVSEKVAGKAAALQQQKAAVGKELPGKLETVMEKGKLQAQRQVEAGAAGAEKMVGEGQAAGKALVEKTAADTAWIGKDQAPVEKIRGLLRTGTPGQIAQASRYLAGVPGGKEALEGSVRNTLASASLSPGALRTLWEDRLHWSLKEGGLLDAKTLQKLDADVKEVLRKESPKVARTTVQKLLNAALATAPGRGVEAIRRPAEGQGGGQPKSVW